MIFVEPEEKAESPEPDEYDPPEYQRTYLRSVITGDRGWLVRRDGRQCVKLDRPNQDVCQPYRRDLWKGDAETRPYSISQMAQVAYEADRKLAQLEGRVQESRLGWLDMSETERIRWTKDGPKVKTGTRRELYTAIMGVLRPLAG
jgi:hypothetical protein